MNKKEKEFVKYVKSECKKYGVKCDLRKTKYVRLSGNIKCSGYFDEDAPALVCSMNRKDWIEILAHEFSHLTQWVEQIDIWKKCMVSMPLVDDWLQGEDVPNIKKHLAVSRELELDNEKRSVRIIKKFGLDVDIDNYIKKANAYIFFYTRLLATRKWATPNNSPYTNKRIIEKMPTYFRRDYSIIPSKIEKVFIEENL
jgi:phosphorylcholine metabolism protein LicD